MFKFLRKALISLAVALVALSLFLYLRSADRRRAISQTTVELREALSKDPKRPIWEGTVVVSETLEGDRLRVNTEASQRAVVRLAGIDSPEMPDRFQRNGQPLAAESREFLASMVSNKAAQMSIVGTDAAKCPLVLLHVDGTLVNVSMVAAGFAEAGGEGMEAIPAKLRHSLENAELQAKSQLTNIWSLTNYVRPVEHRIRLQRGPGALAAPGVAWPGH